MCEFVLFPTPLLIVIFLWSMTPCFLKTVYIYSGVDKSNSVRFPLRFFVYIYHIYIGVFFGFLFYFVLFFTGSPFTESSFCWEFNKGIPIHLGWDQDTSASSLVLREIFRAPANSRHSVLKTLCLKYSIMVKVKFLWKRLTLTLLAPLR